MRQIIVDDQLYDEAERRARAAGFSSVDEFVAEQLESIFVDEGENLDDRFTPEVLAGLDQISNEMHAGKMVSTEDIKKHITDIREAWLKKNGR